MKTLFYSAGVCISLFLFLSVVSCKTQSMTGKSPRISSKMTAKRAMSLTMPDGSGTNGAGVAYIPEKKQWYAAFAGNTYFPLAVFNQSGQLISKDLKTHYDARGFWYNPNSFHIEGNGYGDEGIIEITMDEKGIPNGYENIFEGNGYQPSDQCVGVYDPESNEILYFSDGEISRYDRKTGNKVGVLGFKNSLNPYEFVSETLVFTGWKGAEIGLLNFKKNTIHLFDKATLQEKGIIKLPPNIPSIEESFNFSFANGYFWIFNTAERKWIGYKAR